MTTYQQCKALLSAMAKAAKRNLVNDKPAIRQAINDYADTIGRDYRLTTYQINLLSNFACKLHP